MISSARSRPTISLAVYPNVRSVAWLTSTTRPLASIVMMQSNAALRIALLRASLSRSRSSARQRSTHWPIRPPRLVIVASRLSSGSRRRAARNSTAAITPDAPWIGKQNAVRRPDSTAVGPRGSVRVGADVGDPRRLAARPHPPGQPFAGRQRRGAARLDELVGPLPGLDAAQAVRAPARPTARRCPSRASRRSRRAVAGTRSPRRAPRRGRARPHAPFSGAPRRRDAAPPLSSSLFKPYRAGTATPCRPARPPPRPD